MNEIVLVIGIQGSGKSTHVEPFVQRGYIRLNRDQMGASTSMAAVLAHLMSAMLVQKKSVVLDNTFCTAIDRYPFIDAAHKCGYKARALVMDTSFEDAQYNVCQRMIRNGGKLLGPEDYKTTKAEWAIPPAAMFAYRKKYEAPRTTEGFDSIEPVHFVRKNDSGYTNKAIIVDKDGTLTESICGAKFPCTAADVRALKGRTAVLTEWKKKGYKLLGVSNQSGIGKGDIDPVEAVRIFNKTNELIGHDIDWNYCAHRSPPAVFCYCRKPSSGLGVLHIENHKLNASECIFVGDMTTDKTFAARCGFRYVDASKFFA